MMLLVGTNTTEAHPVIGYKMRQAARRGCKMVVCDPRRIDLVDDADYWLRQKPGTDTSPPQWINAHHYQGRTGKIKQFISERNGKL